MLESDLPEGTARNVQQGTKFTDFVSSALGLVLSTQMPALRHFNNRKIEDVRTTRQNGRAS